MKAVWLLTAISLLLIQGCAKRYENQILVASCGMGDVYVREQVELKPGLSGTSSSVEFSLYFVDGDRRRFDILASSLGSYRPAAADRLKVYRTAREGDWQLYVAPAAFPLDEYAVLSTCIGSKMADIEREMALPREPRSFRSAQRTFPRIATIRHADLMDLRKRYACNPHGAIHVREDGQVWYHGQAQVLIGRVRNDGKRITLNEAALRYLASYGENVTRNPMSYLQRCEEPSGRSMFESFDVSTLSEALTSAGDGADKPELEQPDETSAANERAPKNTAE